jgi:hypothetical protein
MIRRLGPVLLAAAVIALAAVGIELLRVAVAANHWSVVPVAGTPSHLPPGARGPAPTPPSGDLARASGPPDFADNEGFLQPEPLPSASLKAGQAEEQRIRAALAPAAARIAGDPAQVRARLEATGVAADHVIVEADGTGTAFTLTLPTMCVEGTVYPSSSIRVLAFSGYPDSGCTPHAGGH